MSVAPRKCHILVTLGPTWEFIDPIRYIANRATGILGYRIAQEALRRGHRVTCIAGPTALLPLKRARWINVVSTKEMERAVRAAFPETDALVMTAAAADYCVKKPFPKKLKRKRKSISLVLDENPDIVGRLGPQKGKRVLVGFALETEDLVRNALKKLRGKRLDLVVGNLMNRKNDPFGDRRMNAHLLWKDGRRCTLKRISKRKLAADLLNAIEALIATGDKALAR